LEKIKTDKKVNQKFKKKKTKKQTNQNAVVLFANLKIIMFSFRCYK